MYKKLAICVLLIGKTAPFLRIILNIVKIKYYYLLITSVDGRHLGF